MSICFLPCFSCLILFNYERYERHRACSLDCLRKCALVFCADAMALRRIDLSLRVHETAQKICVFVIYLIHFFLAKIARFLFHIDLCRTAQKFTEWHRKILCFCVILLYSVFSCLLLKWHVFNFYFILFLIEIDGWNFFGDRFRFFDLRSCCRGCRCCAIIASAALWT